MVVINAKVWAVDKARPRAEAIAIVGDRIAAVGTRIEIEKWVGKETRTLDAHGKSVLPGLIDSHVHFSSGGFEISGVHLKDTANPEEFKRLIAEHVKKLKKGEWMLGGTWDDQAWPGAPMPSREWIDSITPNNPAFLSRYDGHMSLANSLALKLAGVTRDTPTPAGGTIVKDASGEPTGLMKDAAKALVDRIIPEPSEAQLTAAVKAALTDAARFGVTGIHAMSSAEDLRIYQELLARGELTARLYAITPIQQWNWPGRAGIMAGFGNEWIRTGALKGFADGSLGSTTAWFFKPYEDAPEAIGLRSAMMYPDGNMLKMVSGADKAGLQICIHAIGDKAIREILDIYAEVEKQNGINPNRRWRIEHAQHMHPDDFTKFARLGVVASMQPYHAIDDGRWAEKRIGHERGKTTYAFRTFLDQGVKLAFGSDWTVAPLNPLLGMHAAVTRQTLDGKNPGGWYPEQKITLAEAIEAYTMGSAFAEHGEDQKGSITAGKLADIIVLDQDLFSIPPEKIKNASVVTTIVGGKIVFAKKQ
ncbi:MAG: amidohydrolase [Acidobacteria bacterium]|nr:amidohydrolase [Acidobacteriota bacterium]